MTDPISDMLARIRNAQQRVHEGVKIPFSRLKLEVVKILYQEGYIGSYRLVSGQGPQKWIEIGLRYIGKRDPLIREMKRVSRPGRRVTIGFRELLPVKSGLAISILSTSKGVMTDRQAREAKLGGEVL